VIVRVPVEKEVDSEVSLGDVMAEIAGLPEPESNGKRPYEQAAFRQRVYKPCSAVFDRARLKRGVLAAALVEVQSSNIWRV